MNRVFIFMVLCLMAGSLVGIGINISRIAADLDKIATAQQHHG